MAEENEVNGNEPVKLDIRDKRILYELDFNGRATRSELAKLTGISSPVIHYRITRFEEQGVIKKYLLLVNLNKIGEYQMKMCLQFRQFDNKTKNDMLKFLRGKPYVRRIVTCHGAYDMFITIGAKTVHELNKMKEEIYERIDPNITSEAIAIILDIVGYRRDYLVGRGAGGPPIAVTGADKAIELDEEEIKILESMKNDGNISIADIARKIKSTPGVVSRRLKDLEKKGIILGCRLQLDYSKVGLRVNKIFISTQKDSRKIWEDLRRYCNTKPNITHLEKVLGTWDIEIEFELFATDDFTAMLEDLRSNFSDIIKRIDIVRITEDYTYSYY